MNLQKVNAGVSLKKNIKIGFYFDNKNNSNIDFRKVAQGNPGVGGSEYSVVLISYLLSVRDNKINVCLFCTSEGVFPEKIDICVIEDLKSCIYKADFEGYDYLVVDSKKVNPSLLNTIRCKNVKLLLWANNFISKHELDDYAKIDSVYKIVNVGREQFELWVDHPIFDKSCYIYNTMPFPKDKDILKPSSMRQPIVVYIGSLVKSKGFGALAKAWPKVLNDVPEAQLYVIGSGKLYDKNAILGKYSIADENFENEFMPYLLDSKGQILPSVHFLGVLGQEKYNILAKAKVGVPNPIGQTETFGYSAIEMQYMGCSITTMKCPGFLDTTIQNGSNILYANVKRLHKCIVKILKSKENVDVTKTRSCIENQFGINVVVEQWELLLTTDYVPNRISYKNLFYRLKWMKIINYRLCKLFRIRPFVSFEYLHEYIDKINSYVNR